MVQSKAVLADVHGGSMCLLVWGHPSTIFLSWCATHKMKQLSNGTRGDRSKHGTLTLEPCLECSWCATDKMKRVNDGTHGDRSKRGTKPWRGKEMLQTLMA